MSRGTRTLFRTCTAGVLAMVLAAAALIATPPDASAATAPVASEATCAPATGTFGTAPWSLSADCVVHIGAGVLGTGPLDDVVGNSEVRSILFDQPASTAFGTTSTGTFRYLPELTRIDGISQVNTSRLRHFSNMFDGASSLTDLDLSGWDVSQAVSMSSMFRGMSRLRSLDVSTWKTQNLTSTYAMFQDASSLTQVDVSGWNTARVTSMFAMFDGASALTDIDVSKWDTSSVTSMDWMFRNASSLTALDVSAWDTGRLTSAASMFEGATNLVSLDLSSWDMRYATSLYSMFEGASSLTSIDLTGWDLRSATYLSGMFEDASALRSLDLSSWDTTSVSSFASMLSGTTSLSTLILGEKTKVSWIAWLPSVPTNTAYAGVWQSIGDGTASAPTGSWIGTSTQLLEHSGTPGSAATYVWQPAVTPIFDAHPADIRVDEGATATMTASASGRPAPALNWEYRGGPDSAWSPVDRYIASVSDAGKLLTISGDVTKTGLQFRAVASSTAGTVPSRPATFTVTPTPITPSFSAQPNDAWVEENTIASFYAHAWGEPAPILKWNYRATPNGTWRDVTTTVGRSSDDGYYLHVAASLPLNGYQFRVVAENSAGSITSAPATLTVTQALVAPHFAQQPESIKVAEGQAATFTVAVSGVPRPAITWDYFDAAVGGWQNVTPGLGAVSSEGTQLTVPGTAKTNGIKFRAVAKSATGQQISNAATLTVTLPAITVRINRYQGPNRYATNHDLNAKTMKAGKPLFVATGGNFPDALSVGPAVALLEGSLVLTTKDGIAKPTLDLIRSRKPSAVYIIGGTGVVSSQVAAQLTSATGRQAIRVSGANRYETSSAIFKRFFKDRTVKGAFVATGRDFPDALSAASAGGALGYPVLLVDGKSTSARLQNTMVSLLKDRGVKELTIVGGTGVILPQVSRNIAAQGFRTSSRIAGINRYDTNLNLNTYVDSNTPAIARTGIWVATGANFPDAISAASPAGSISRNQRLVLSNGTCLPYPVVSDWIRSPKSRVKTVSLVGGTGVLRSSVASLAQCR